MPKENKSTTRRRLAGAYVSSLISITLVLALVGLSAFIVINAKRVSDYFKESLEISVLMKTDVTDEGAAEYKAYADSLPFVRTASVVTKAQGVEELKKMLGEDFLDVFEASPVPASVDVTLKADYISADSLAMVKSILGKPASVDEVSCQQSLVEALDANVTKITLVIGAFIILLLFVSFVLIGNTVRANLFAKRFTIHTMKLTGATRAFIRAPFLLGAVMQGLISAALAIGLLYLGLHFAKSSFEALFAAVSLQSYLMVVAAVVASGVLICLLSTFFTVGKLISMDKDDLYY